MASLKFDHNLKLWGREQSFTGRYNRTHDRRDIPGAGGALFAVLRPIVGTQNFSFYWNSELSGPEAATPLFNQFRASYGRTRLQFEEVRDQEHLIPSSLFPNEAFLLNAPQVLNVTLPGASSARYGSFIEDTETGSNGLGPVGQVILPGFSPLGVDVNNFPQRRVNNTFQIADIFSFRKGAHNVSLGTDIRRVHLNSDLPRNARPQITFGGSPDVLGVANGELQVGFFGFLSPTTLAAASAASNFSQTLALRTANIGLRTTQWNYFAQDEWRINPKFSLSFGARYEYNTPPREVNGLIERSFRDPLLDKIEAVSGLKRFLDNRQGIFDPDRNNLAPRVGFAYGHSFAVNRQMVIRGGYGWYFDQALGAVISQSRNVFPNFLTVNFGGGEGGRIDGEELEPFDLFNPATGFIGVVPIRAPGTLNRLNPALTVESFVNAVNNSFPQAGFGFTLPARRFPMPFAQQFSATIEQQLSRHLFASASYVGTLGRHLLRQTTPNLGPNLTMITSPLLAQVNNGSPELLGLILQPGQRLNDNLDPVGQRPFDNVGTVYLYETTANSRYDSLQAQLRGQLEAVSFQISYTFSKALDDVSDVFDLAGAPSLPQNSLRPSERGLANFDTRHRFTYTFNWALPRLNGKSKLAQMFFGGFDFAGTGQYQAGQPFTINSIFDVNLDGNLTDRLNTTNGLAYTGNRRQPIRLTAADAAALRAAIGNTGAVGRNTFRSSGYLLLNLALTKNFIFTEHQRLILRVEAFNFLNRANFALPVRLLEAPSFGESVDTLTPGRRLQLALKYQF